jgi:signal transduction histidine kinase
MTRREEEELLDVIVRDSKRLLRLTDHILDVTKIESRTLFLKKENSSEMVMEILDEYGQRIKNRNTNNIILSYKSQENDANIIEVDRSRLCQVVNSLLSNAFKFTNEESITVTVERIANGNPY